MKENSVQWYDAGWHTITIGEGKERLEGKTQLRPMKEMQYSTIDIAMYWDDEGWYYITIGEGKIVLFVGKFGRVEVGF